MSTSAPANATGPRERAHTQIQALDRTQPGLRLKKGRAATMTHHDKRHGTTTLFAALDVKSGMVIGECLPRHRAREFLRFLCSIDRAILKPRDVHLLLDNYATHKTPEVKTWLEKLPRFRARCGHSDSGFPRGLICDSLCLWQMLGVIDGQATSYGATSAGC